MKLENLERRVNRIEGWLWYLVVVVTADLGIKIVHF